MIISKQKHWELKIIEDEVIICYNENPHTHIVRIGKTKSQQRSFHRLASIVSHVPNVTRKQPLRNGAFSPTEDGAVCFFTTCRDLSGAHPMEGPVLTHGDAPIHWLLPKGTWWIMMNHEDIWWYMMIYVDIWWYMMMNVDIWTSTAWGFLSHQPTYKSLGVNMSVP